MAGVLTPLIAVGHHRSPLSLIRLALSRGNTGTQGIWAILGCEMLIGHPISGISLDASASLLAAPEMLPSRYLHQNRKFVRITMFWSGRGTGRAWPAFTLTICLIYTQWIIEIGLVLKMNSASHQWRRRP